MCGLPPKRHPEITRSFQMSNELTALSQELAGAVEQAGRHVVAIHARPRYPSSGVFWRPGVIVSAEHTIRREEEITVTLPDGTTAHASLVGSDPGTDIAVLRVESAGQPIGSTATSIAPGHLALAIGRSPDSGVNATMGIVSAFSGEWRTWRGGRLDHYIRLDLTLYPGSSGGLVINTSGEVIGVATSVLSRIAGLAIPAVTINRVVDEILSRGHVSRGYLGVGLQPVELPNHQKGLIVLSLEPEGPAARAGILIGDILVAIGGAAVGDTDDVQLALERNPAGSTAELELLRGGASQKLPIVVGERRRA
jgi:S1-C subfamily serine protease